jgi:hypothetical protein
MGPINVDAPQFSAFGFPSAGISDSARIQSALPWLFFLPNVQLRQYVLQVRLRALALLKVEHALTFVRDVSGLPLLRFWKLLARRRTLGSICTSLANTTCVNAPQLNNVPQCITKSSQELKRYRRATGSSTPVLSGAPAVTTDRNIYQGAGPSVTRA